jgi:hypothetical protein
VPTCFGADSVASALHLRQGATPGRRDQTNMSFRIAQCQPEVSTLQKTGSFYFALTSLLRGLTPITALDSVKDRCIERSSKA